MVYSLSFGWPLAGPSPHPQIARALEGNARLRTLIVESNELGFAAGEAFAKALVLNKSLTALSLMDNPRLGDAACEALNYSLYHNSSLKVRFFSFCHALIHIFPSSRGTPTLFNASRVSPAVAPAPGFRRC